MKRFILLSAILSFACFTNAQTPAPTATPATESTLRLGLHFTPTIGYIKSDLEAVKKAGAQLGYNWGLVFDIKFADNYFFSTGIDVINSPVKFNKDTLTDATSTYVNVDLRYKLQFLGIPLSVKLKTNEVHFMRYYGLFGMEPQFNISKKVNPNKGTYGSDYVTPSKNTFTNFDADINFIRLAVIVGGGFEYSLGGKTALVAGLTYNGGFTDLNKDPKSKITNSYVALNLGVLF